MIIFKHQQCNMNSCGQIQLTQPSHLSPPLFIPVLGGIHIEFEGRIIQVEAQSLEFVAIHMHEGLQIGGHRGPYQTECGMKNKKKNCFSWNCPRFWGCAADDVESLLCLQIMFRFSHARQTHQKTWRQVGRVSVCSQSSSILMLSWWRLVGLWNNPGLLRVGPKDVFVPVQVVFPHSGLSWFPQCLGEKLKTTGSNLLNGQTSDN